MPTVSPPGVPFTRFVVSPSIRAITWPLWCVGPVSHVTVASCSSNPTVKASGAVMGPVRVWVVPPTPLVVSVPKFSDHASTNHAGILGSAVKATDALWLTHPPVALLISSSRVADWFVLNTPWSVAFWPVICLKLTRC